MQDLIQLNVLGNKNSSALCFRLRLCTSKGFPFSSLPVEVVVECEKEPNDNSALTMLETHCGVKEFTAKEGDIVLSHAIYKTFYGEPGHMDNETDVNNHQQLKSILNTKIQLKYVLLPKIHYLLVQPEMNRFTTYISEVKRCLEENLIKYTTLTRNNRIVIWYRGQSFNMIIKEIRRDPTLEELEVAEQDEGVVEEGGLNYKKGISGTALTGARIEIEAGLLVDTDVVIDFLESVEYLEHQGQISLPQKQQKLDNVASSASKSYRLADFPSNNSSDRETSCAMTKLVREPASNLPPFPLEDEPKLNSNLDGELIFACRIRVNAQKVVNLSRRFYQREAFLRIFQYIRKEVSQNPDFDNEFRSLLQTKLLSLTARYPTRVYLESDYSANANVYADAKVGVEREMTCDHGRTKAVDVTFQQLFNSDGASSNSEETFIADMV